MEKPLFSIIIPHKNCPHLLQKCIDSIPKRNDLEIIIVDDNSNKEKVDFEHFPGLDNNNIKVIFTKEGKGAGYARNIGINYAQGKWLLFADADDWYEPNINNLFEKYASDNVHDLVYLNAQYVDENNKIFPFYMSRYISNYLKRKILSEKVLRYGVWTPWTRMVKRSFVEKYQMKFEEIPLANDMKFCLDCSYNTENFDVFPEIVYNYYKPSCGSLTDKHYTHETYMLRLNIKMELNRFYTVVDYPFKWPLWTALSLHRFKTREEKALAKKIRKNFLNNIGGYNFFKDTYYTLFFVFGKILHII